MVSFSFLILSMFIMVAQTTIFSLAPQWVGRPDFIFILVVFAAYRFSWIRGLLYVFILGWMMDVLAGIHLGIFPLQNIIVFSILKFLTENSPLKESAYQIPLVGVSYFIVQMGFYFFYSVLMPGVLPEWSWNRMIQDTFILLLAAIPSFVLLGNFQEFFSQKRSVHRVVRKRTGNQFR